MKLVYQRLISQILLILGIFLILTILLKPTWLSFLLTVTTGVLIHKLYWQIRFNEVPQMKDWLVQAIKAIFWTSLFLILFALFGFMGWIGLLMLSILLAALRIYQGRNLFTAYITWAADRAWGKTKENFDFEKVLEGETKDDEQRKDKRDISESRETRTGEIQRSHQESGSVVDESQHSNKHPKVVPQVLHENKSDVFKRRPYKKRRVVQKLPEDL